MEPHDRPPGASDDAVAAAGHMSEALETLERARGHLYSFHQLIGEAHFALDDVLRPGCGPPARRISRPSSSASWSAAMSSRVAGHSRSWRSSTTATASVFRDYERRVR